MRQNLRFFLIAPAKWNTFCRAALFPFAGMKAVRDQNRKLSPMGHIHIFGNILEPRYIFRARSLDE
jgi:hypothetical protein